VRSGHPALLKSGIWTSAWNLDTHFLISRNLDTHEVDVAISRNLDAHMCANVLIQ